MKMMKQTLAMVLAMLLLLSMAACDPAAPAGTTAGNPSETTAAPSSEPTTEPTTEPTEPTINMDGAVSLPDVDCTGGWMASKTAPIVLTGDFEITYAFDYKGGLGVQNPWENVVIEFYGDGNWLTIVCNGDGWTVGDKWIKPTNTFTVPDNVDPMTILADAEAVVTFKRVGSKITIDGTFTGGGEKGVWYAETDDAGIPETVNFHIGGEYSKITNLRAIGIPEQPINMDGAVALPDVDCSAGWMAAKTEPIVLTGDFELTYAFDYKGGLNIQNPWENVVIEFYGDGNWLTIVANGDGWTVGDKWIKPTNTFTVPDNVDPMTILADAKAVVTFKRVGSKITIDGTFTGGGEKGVWHAETDDAGIPETVNFHIGGEYCKITNLKVKGLPEKPVEDNTLPDVDCSTGWMAAKTEDISLTGDFEMTYKFDYAGLLGAKNPWENIVVEFFGEGNWLTIVCNGDGWTVGDKWLKPTNTFTTPEGVDAAQILEGCKAEVTFKRVGNKITVDGTFTNGDLVGTWHAETDEPALPETLSFHMGGEFCKLTNITCTK